MSDNSSQERAERIVRFLIWTYFILLIIEGALRKWVVPQLSNPLLVVRDPVALAIYFFSIRAIYAFPKECSGLLTLVFNRQGSAPLSAPTWRWMDYLPYNESHPHFGRLRVHANFFHLPLIFVMAKVLRPEDIQNSAGATLVIIIPMTFLMIAQFRADPGALINSTAGGEGEMMTAALGKVRTAGPFSFVIGVVLYFSLATAFLLWGVLKRGVYKIVAFAFARPAAALVIGVSVSGSRSAVASCALVVASLAVVFVFRRDALNRSAQILLVTVILGLIISRTPIFKEGLNVLTTRFNEVAEQTQESVARGIVGRLLSEFTESAEVWTRAPLFGYGLGIGTNAGANILTGHSMFLLTEGEWSRIVLESGKLLGLAYIVWRDRPDLLTSGLSLYSGFETR